MEFLAFHSWVAPLLRHLSQSTILAGGVWLLTLLLRGNAARVRYRLWMLASLKFLLPFSLLIGAGAKLASLAHFDRTRPEIATVVEGVAQPLLHVWPAQASAKFVDARVVAQSPAGHSATPWLPLLLPGVWAAGVLSLLGLWAKNWLALRALVRRGEPMTLADGTPALLVAENLEPGMIGILRPLLVLPRGIAERLSAEQLNAVVTHELSHLRRRDNLTAALHMAVQALFWFHPLVWWLGSRLMEERERACDEAVLDASIPAYAYAEGILSVCKFCLEAPLICVSGVTGSDLKHRIARILSGQAARKLDLRRKMLLVLAAAVALGTPLALGVAHAFQEPAPTPAPAPTAAPGDAGITGSWQGTAHQPGGRSSRFVLRIARDENGKLSATMYGLDQDGPPMIGSSVSFSAGILRFANFYPGMSLEGRLSSDGNSISATVVQNGTFPLLLVRAAPGAEWATPAAPPRIASMAPGAKPDVEVATVKPTAPNARAFMITIRGGDLSVSNQTLSDLIRFAYEVQGKQISGGPAWMDTDRWDIEAKPDTPGMPSNEQIRELMQKLLAERFGLRVHQAQRELPAYALTIGKDGPRLTKSADSSGLAGFSMGPLGVMHAGSATMADFVHILQNGILDRPVLDETGLNGHWDFTLKWTPDESQFVGMPVRVSQPVDDANAPPPLFTAIQEQLGLKLEAQKAEVPVLVIDHVDRPAPN